MTTTTPTCLPFSVTLPASPDGWQILAVFYGYTPFLYLLACLVLFFVNRGGTREIAYMVLGGVATGICEILKLFILGSRPGGACISASYGMPSGHSCMSLAWVTVLALDMTISKSRASISLTTVGLTMLLLLPVPVSRIILQDHSPSQAMAGSLIGIVLAAVWFVVSLPIRDYFSSRLGTKVLWVLTHNYPPIAPIKADDDLDAAEPLSV